MRGAPVTPRATMGAMGSYYSPGNEPGGDEGGWRETIAIIIVVFRVLAKPLALLFGVLFGLVFIFWAFTVSPFAGLGLLLLIVAALIARGIWEAKHPPEIR